MECSIKNISINYEIIGEGKPVVMIHGYGVDHRIISGCMEPVFTNNDGFKRIYIDLPGMGRSSSAEWINNSDCMLEIVVEFINKILKDENFLLVGESYGGYLARGIVYKMPERVEGVLLICPVIIAEHKKRNVPEHIVLVDNHKLLSKLSPKEASNFYASSVVHSDDIYERYVNEIVAGIELANSKFLKELMENGYSFSFDVDNINFPFQKPSLFLLGKQDSCVGYKDPWHILKNYPRATFAVLDRAGHNLQLEQPELFNSMVSEWLLRCSEELYRW